VIFAFYETSSLIGDIDKMCGVAVGDLFAVDCGGGHAKKRKEFSK
jgi:hypothetical protein